ncbi:MAG: 50S ribosomal protein L10 [Candidatus Omnitrophica bacterium]|nr:50S ribosomal protein L10 [Candidatus Omnitrophota bacterium]
MKKLGVIVKEASQDRIKDNLKDSNAVFIVKYSGLSSPDMTSLRQSLKDSRASLFVIKNAVARRALKDAGLESLVKSIEGPCGVIFVKDEPVNTSRALCNFSKGHEQLKIEAGLLEEKLLAASDIQAMAKLPSKEVLRAQVVMALSSPISGLVVTLNQVLAKFVYCIDQIKMKREK